MFIHKLGLKNFKCFKEVEVSFGKITLLTGENSSGKSSLIYGLLAPFQSDRFPLYLFPNGKYVNMGDFEEMSFRNKKDNIIEIDIDMEIDFPDMKKFYTQWILDKINYLPKLYNLEIENEDDYSDNKFKISFDNDQARYSYFNKELEEERIVKNLEEIIYDVDFSRNLISLIDPNYITQNLNLNFIGSYRLYPERTYYQKPKASSQVSRSGEGLIDQILEWQEKEYEEFNQLINILKELKLLYDIKPDKLRGGRFDLRVKVKKNSNWASLTDVGFGVSQLLPILVADLQLSDDSTLIMAQPEIHLHPRIQAELGTYLVNQVNKLDKQYIVETHSEYLINRLRLCIVKGEIEPEDVAVYYFENTQKEGSITHKIEFTKQGQILNAPQGFFDTYMIDTMDIALNA